MADYLSSQLVRYDFENNLTDATGNGNTARVGYGPTVYEAGAFNGSSARFYPGTPAFSDLIVPALGSGFTEWSIACVIKPNTYKAPNDLNTIFATDTSDKIRLAFLWGTYLTLWINGTPVNLIDSVLSTVVPTGRWTYIVVTYKAGTGTAKLYINGSLYSTLTGLSGNVDMSGESRIGILESDINQSLDANVDKFTVWNRELTAADVTALITSTITVTEQPDKSVKQRQPNSTTKFVQFFGTCDVTLATPASLELQLYNAGTINVAMAWSPLFDFDVNGVVVTGAYRIPQGGMYNHQIRTKDSGGNVLETSLISRNKWGVGLVIPCLGQSNEVAQFDENDGSIPALNPNTSQYRAGVWADLSANGSRSLANRIQTVTGLPVGLVAYAVGGTTIADWLGGAPWISFSNALTATGGDCEFGLMYLGESDSQLGTSKATMKAGLAAFKSQFLTITNRNVNTFKLGVVLFGNIDTGSSDDTSTQNVRQGEQEFIYETPGVFFAASAIDMVRKAADGLHIDAPSHTHMGLRMSQAVLKQLGFASYGADGGRITYASSNKIGGVTNIDITVKHDGGTALVSGGGDLTGFTVANDAAFTSPLTYASVSILSATKIRISFSSIIAGPFYLRHDWGENPTVSNQVYDNTSPGGDSLGLPVQPLATFLVDGARNNGRIILGIALTI